VFCPACERHARQQYLLNLALSDLTVERVRLREYVATLTTRAQVDSFRIALKTLLNERGAK
jgi:hypothetical protein